MNTSMYGNPAHMRVRDATCTRGSQIERGIGIWKTSLARDGAMHLGSFKGSLQDDEKNRGEVGLAL